MTARQYATPLAFKQALEQRLAAEIQELVTRDRAA